MKLAEKIATGFHIFNGIGAMFGGVEAIRNPISPFGMSAAEVLVNAPFKDFLIPGLFLLFVLSLGNLFAAFSIFRKWKLRGWISGFFATALVVWIVVQCIMLLFIDVLHIIYFFIGGAQGLLALYIIISERNKSTAA